MNADQPDPIVDWTPIKESGASFATNKLKKIDDETLDFVPTTGFVFFSLFFLLGGLFILSRVVFYLSSEDDGFYVALIIGSLFTLVGGYLLFGSKNRIIIRNMNGSWRISKSNVFARMVKFIPAKPFYAIQVLEKHYDSTTSYELNIVYQDGTRESILNQGHRELVIESGAILAESIKIPFLNGVKTGKPLWK